jgi:hypothetical protein
MVSLALGWRVVPASKRSVILSAPKRSKNYLSFEAGTARRLGHPSSIQAVGPTRYRDCVKTPGRGCAARCAVVAPRHLTVPPDYFWAMPPLGAQPQIPSGLAGRAQPFRTSGGKAADRVFTQSLPRGGTDLMGPHTCQ